MTTGDRRRLKPPAVAVSSTLEKHSRCNLAWNAFVISLDPSLNFSVDFEHIAFWIGKIDGAMAARLVSGWL
jgi:hypothetical protein